MRHDAPMARRNNVIPFPPEWERYRARHRARAGRGWAWLALVMLVAFGLALGAFRGGLLMQWEANPGDPAPPMGDRTANEWQAPANLPRPTAPSPSPARTIGGTGGGVAAPTDTLRARFGLCHSGGGTNCVVDGDTFWFQSQKIRIADIDTPETHPPRCAEEARLGEAATERLHGLLNAGPFSLEGADTDRYGRALHTVTRGGDSLGGVLVGEGLARWYGSGRQPWC